MAGRRNTWQRRAILSVLDGSSAPVSAESIYRRLIESGRSLNLSTVYRNLGALEENHVVHRLVPGDGKKALYSLHGENCNTHMLICRKCGKTQLTRWCPLERMGNMLEDDSFYIECHHLEIRGVCGKCKRAFGNV
ncbi:MAG: Fur family transcriptional regulator [Chitinispirillaceae bacterium]